MIEEWRQAGLRAALHYKWEEEESMSSEPEWYRLCKQQWLTKIRSHLPVAGWCPTTSVIEGRKSFLSPLLSEWKKSRFVLMNLWVNFPIPCLIPIPPLSPIPVHSCVFLDVHTHRHMLCALWCWPTCFPLSHPVPLSHPQFWSRKTSLTTSASLTVAFGKPAGYNKGFGAGRQGCIFWLNLIDASIFPSSMISIRCVAAGQLCCAFHHCSLCCRCSPVTLL